MSFFLLSTLYTKNDFRMVLCCNRWRRLHDNTLNIVQFFTHYYHIIIIILYSVGTIILSDIVNSLDLQYVRIQSFTIFIVYFISYTIYSYAEANAWKMFRMKFEQTCQNFFITILNYIGIYHRFYIYF